MVKPETWEQAGLNTMGDNQEPSRWEGLGLGVIRFTIASGTHTRGNWRHKETEMRFKPQVTWRSRGVSHE